MEDIDVDKFTTLLKAKESIWNYKSTAYANKTQRRNDWISVCQGMVPDFEEKTNEEKNDIVLQHQTKWRVLRDGFTRSVKNYNEKLEQGNKGKLYLYYEQLHFLHDLYDVKTMVGQSDKGDISQRKPRSRKRGRRYNGESSQDTEHQRSTEDIEKEGKRRNKAAENNDENGMEEDKHFLLSLLNDFRKIPEDQKLDAKGDIISVIRHYRNTHFDARGAYCNNATALPATATASYFDNDVKDDSRQSCSPIEIKFNVDAPNNDPLKYS